MSQLANLRLAEEPIPKALADSADVAPNGLAYNQLSDCLWQQQLINKISSLVTESALADRRPRTERVICQEVARAASEATLDEIWRILKLSGLVYDPGEDQPSRQTVSAEINVEKGDT